MNKLEEKLEMKVKDCYNTNTIFDKRKYVLLSDAKKVLNEALTIPDVVSTSCDLTDDELKRKIRLADIDYHLRKERS